MTEGGYRGGVKEWKGVDMVGESDRTVKGKYKGRYRVQEWRGLQTR